MKKISIISEVKNGKLTRNRNLILDVIESREGKTIQLDFSAPTKKKSTPQNNYYWGVVVPIWKKALRESQGEIFSNEEVNYFLKYNFNGGDIVNEETGESLKVAKSSTSNSTTEQEEFHKRCRDVAFDMFNIIIPLPNEDLKLKF